jgi:hypothetical protein
MDASTPETSRAVSFSSLVGTGINRDSSLSFNRDGVSDLAPAGKLEAAKSPAAARQ